MIHEPAESLCKEIFDSSIHIKLHFFKACIYAITDLYTLFNDIILSIELFCHHQLNFLYKIIIQSTSLMWLFLSDILISKCIWKQKHSRTPAYLMCFKMYFQGTLILICTCRSDNSIIIPWHFICPKQINTANEKISWYGKPIYVLYKI